MQKKIRHPVWFAVFLALTLAWIAFIFCRSAQPASASSEESGTLLLWLQQFFPWMTDKIVRKTAHFTEFFILGGLVSCTVRSARKNIPWPAMAAGLAVAVTDELIQLTQQGRSCEVRDMCIDTAGAVLAALLLWLLFRLIEKKQQKKGL